MGRSTDPLVVGKVVGDVIDLFIPSVDLSVSYPVKHVNNGCEIKPSGVFDPPHVSVGRHPYDHDSLYTLVMTDPDAPSPSEPHMREWVHWIVADIPGGSDASQGREILPYEAPTPPVGIHRYVFVLFKQIEPMLLMPPFTRQNFRTRVYAADYNLGLPVAAVYFNCQKQKAGRRR